ncbi:Uncharacterised protein [Bifidobacterium catenulatum]|nr:Uncharacterised protein [Bifidobacterium catenulatum]
MLLPFSRTGLYAALSTMTPTATHMRIAGMTATHAGRPNATIAGMVSISTYAPTMMKSPCAKLIKRMMPYTMV